MDAMEVDGSGNSSWNRLADLFERRDPALNKYLHQIFPDLTPGMVRDLREISRAFRRIMDSTYTYQWRAKTINLNSPEDMDDFAKVTERSYSVVLRNLDLLHIQLDTSKVDGYTAERFLLNALRNLTQRQPQPEFSLFVNVNTSRMSSLGLKQSPFSLLGQTLQPFLECGLNVNHLCSARTFTIDPDLFPPTLSPQAALWWSNLYLLDLKLDKDTLYDERYWVPGRRWELSVGRMLNACGNLQDLQITFPGNRRAQPPGADAEFITACLLEWHFSPSVVGKSLLRLTIREAGVLERELGQLVRSFGLDMICFDRCSLPPPPAIKSIVDGANHGQPSAAVWMAKAIDGRMVESWASVLQRGGSPAPKRVLLMRPGWINARYHPVHAKQMRLGRFRGQGLYSQSRTRFGGRYSRPLLLSEEAEFTRQREEAELLKGFEGLALRDLQTEREAEEALAGFQGMTLDDEEVDDEGV